jgi:hypothetical protein
MNPRVGETPGDKRLGGCCLPQWWPAPVDRPRTSQDHELSLGRRKPLRLNGLEMARGTAHDRNGAAFCAAPTADEQAPNEESGRERPPSRAACVDHASSRGSLTPRSSMSPCSAAVAVLACRMRPDDLGLRVVTFAQCLVSQHPNKRGACLDARRFGRNRRNNILRDGIGGTVSRAEAADLLRAFVEDEGNPWE